MISKPIKTSENFAQNTELIQDKNVEIENWFECHLEYGISYDCNGVPECEELNGEAWRTLISISSMTHIKYISAEYFCKSS